MRRVVLLSMTLAGVALLAQPVEARNWRKLRKTYESSRESIEDDRGRKPDALKKAVAKLKATSAKLLKADQQKTVDHFLSKVLDSPSPIVVDDALSTLGKVDNKRAIKALVRGFSGAKTAARKRMLAGVLATLPDDSVNSGLVRGLKDKNESVRAAVVTALGERGPRAKDAAKRSLERLLRRETSLMIRARAADALELIGGDRPQGYPKAKTNPDTGMPDRWYFDRVAFVLDSSSRATEAGFDDPFAKEDNEAQKQDADKKKGKKKKKKKKKKKRGRRGKKGQEPDEPSSVSAYQVAGVLVREAVGKLGTETRFHLARFGSRVSAYQSGFVKGGKRMLKDLDGWLETQRGRDRNRDVTQAVRRVAELDPPPQEIYLFLTGPATSRGRGGQTATLQAIRDLLRGRPIRLNVVRFMLPPKLAPTSERAKREHGERRRAYGQFVSELSKITGGSANQLELSRTAPKEEKSDKPEKKKFPVDLTKALSSRDAGKVKKAVKKAIANPDSDGRALVEDVAACPDARRATPLALLALKSEDDALARAALRGLIRNADPKVHQDLLKALRGERDLAVQILLIKAIAKYPEPAVTDGLLAAVSSLDPDPARVAWRVLAERPTAQLAAAKTKLVRKSRGLVGLTGFHATRAMAKAIGGRLPSDAGLKTTPSRFLPDRYVARGVAFVVDSNLAMRNTFWKPPAPVKKPEAEDDTKNKKKKKKRRRRRRKKKKKQPEAAPGQPAPVSCQQAVAKEVKRALKAIAKAKGQANVLLTGGRSWQSSCSSLSRRGDLADALRFVDGLRTGNQRDVWTPVQRALNDPKVEQIFLLVSGLPVRSPGAKDKQELLDKVRELNRRRDVSIHVVYVLPPVADDSQEGAIRRDLLSAMNGLYKPLARTNNGEVFVRTSLDGLGKKGAAKSP